MREAVDILGVLDVWYDVYFAGLSTRHVFALMIWIQCWKNNQLISLGNLRARTL